MTIEHAFPVRYDLISPGSYLFWFIQFSINCRDYADGALGGLTNWDQILYIKVNIFCTTSAYTKFYLSSWNHLVIPSFVIPKGCWNAILVLCRCYELVCWLFCYHSPFQYSWRCNSSSKYIEFYWEIYFSISLYTTTYNWSHRFTKMSTRMF
jgi:hypothetical protein